MDQAPPSVLISRRRALARSTALGIAAAATPLCGGWFDRLLGQSSQASADVFKGDAPDDTTWDLWQRRGWAREAAHYLKLDGNVQCKLCPNNCLLSPGDRSHCRNRINRSGTLYTLAWGNPCTLHVDPVEKKPLLHFLPGSRTFSLAVSGCVFRCLNCQNWELSQKKPEETKNPRGAELRLGPPLPARLTRDEMERLSLFPEDLAPLAGALSCPSVAYTYSEPTAWYEYVLASCRALRAARVHNLVVTCGSIEERPLRELLPYVDAVHVDLKGFTEDVYRKLNSGRLEPILRTLRLYAEMDVWFEIVHLIVPTYTDDLGALRRMCDWIVATLGPDRPLHLSRFHPAHKLEHLPPTPIALLVQAREAARAAGLRYVYIGNVRELPDAATTFCPHCRRALVERDGFAVTRLDIVEGKCRHCGTPIAGVWS